MNQTHVDIIKQGAAEWNKWRVENPTVIPDLSGADLRGAALSGADLRAATLKGADLAGANLRAANLRTADLRSANLSGAILWSASLTGADLRGADLTGADLRSVNFRAADLKEANLTDTDLGEANFRTADLSRATLIGARTNDFTDFRSAVISGAKLWFDQDPIDDWDSELWRIANAHTARAEIAIGFKEQLCAADLAGILRIFDNAIYEYEREFILSLKDVLGHSITDACFHRLSAKRRQCVCITSCAPGDEHTLNVQLLPMSLLLLGATICNDVEDTLRRSEICTVLKTAFLRRTSHIAEDLRKLLLIELNNGTHPQPYDLVITTRGSREVMPDLVIRFVPSVVKDGSANWVHMIGDRKG
jgi:hypothetical protein